MSCISFVTNNFCINPLPPIGSLREQHPAHKTTPVCAELHKNYAWSHI